MTDPRQTVVSIVGTVEWQTEVSGFCRCPGEALHTHPNGKKDCRVSVDGAPTIFCFHASCAPVVAEANRRLRRELGGSPWEIKLPGGRVLRSGDILQRNGTVRTRAEIESGKSDTAPGAIDQLVRRTSSGLWPPSPQSGEGRLPGRGGEGERVVLATVRVLAERFAPEMFERFHWPFAQILEDSPLLVAERDAEDQSRTWLRLWPAHSGDGGRAVPARPLAIRVCARSAWNPSGDVASLSIRLGPRRPPGRTRGVARATRKNRRAGIRTRRAYG